MLPTPAPTTPGSSPQLQKSQLPETEVPAYKLPDNAYPEAPQNHNTAPFSVLSGLFDKLQNERKPEKRRRYLSAWFDVRLHIILQKELPLRWGMSSTGVRRLATISTPSYGSFCHKKIGNERSMD